MFRYEMLNKPSTLTSVGNQIMHDFLILTPLKDHPRAKREKISGFTHASRKRMMSQIAMLGDETPIFVTLTYGSEFPTDPSIWKKHQNKFFIYLIRKYPEYSGFWKLEPQKRFAPHWHLLIYGGRIDKEWLARTWAKCSEDESDDHIAAGTRVEALKSVKGAIYYTSKYLAKVIEDELPDYWDNPGRWWGVINRKYLPTKPEKSVVLSELASYALKGYMRDEIESCMISKKHKSLEAQARKKVKDGEDEKTVGCWLEYEKEQAEKDIKLKDWQTPKKMIKSPEDFILGFSNFLADMNQKMIVDMIIKQGFSREEALEKYESNAERFAKELDHIAAIA